MSNAAKHRRTAFFLLAGAVFALMLLFNCLTPYIADDFTFAYAFDTGLRLTSLPQLIQSLAYHYMEWTGRVVVKFFAQGFTMLPKIVFNLCNAAAYLGLGLVIYRLALGRRSGRYDLAAFVLIEASLWEISPAFGQTNLWMCGSCNYLWATLGCLAFLLPWRYYLQKPFASGRGMAAGMAVAGLFAGWLSENTSAGLLVCLVLCAAFLLWQKQKVPAWMLTGLAGALAGFAILIAAPGNYNRANDFVDTSSFLTKYAVRFFNCLNMLWDNALPLLLAFAALYLLLWLQKPGRAALAWPVILLLGGLGANFAMILSPFYYDRSSHGVFSLLTAACAACLVQLDGARLKKLVAVAAACVSVVCVFDLFAAGYDIASYWMMYRTREDLIVAEAAETDSAAITTYGIEPYTRWCGAYGLPDIRESGEDSIGLARSKWYGVADLTADEVHTYPFPGHTNAAYEAGLESDSTEASGSAAG